MTDPLATIPVQVARQAVASSGQLVSFDGPHFMASEDDGFKHYFISNAKVDGVPVHPMLAKVTITRQGQEPRDVLISWDEYFQRDADDPEWQAKWLEQPMTMFGSAAERHGYRVVFADILESLTSVSAPDRIDDAWAVPAGRDWLADVKCASDASMLNVLYDEAREAGALASDAALQGAFTARLNELVAVKKPAPTPVPKPTPKPSVQLGQGSGRRRGGRGRGQGNQQGSQSPQ